MDFCVSGLNERTEIFLSHKYSPPGSATFAGPPLAIVTLSSGIFVYQHGTSGSCYFFAHFSWQNCSSSVRLNEDCSIFNSCQRYSIRLRSGFWSAHSNTFKALGFESLKCSFVSIHAVKPSIFEAN